MALAPRGHGFEQDCSQCKVSPEKRKEWGCDEATVEPLNWIEPCPFCAGKDDACQDCSGSNRVPLHRCPNTMVSQRELDMLTACALVENGILPDQGGWQDQAATFTAAWPIVANEIAHWRGVHRQLAQPKK